MYNNNFPISDLEFGYNLSRMDGQNLDDNNSAINISDVIEVIETDTAFGSMQPKRPSSEGLPNTYVRIVEQPASKALRFRYECEGRSAGSLPGVNSTPEVKTFPTIQIVGYQGRAVVVVSCVTKDPPYRPHPHNLVGKEGCKRGVCTVEVGGETMTATFANLGIQCVKKKDIEEALKVREEMRVDPFRTGFAHKTQASGIDLNSVRLCFQAFLEGPQRGKFTKALTPVVSDPIYDKKAMADLVICKLSHSAASVAGGQDVILLCEKVAKEDISVRFFEEKDGKIFWEGYGDFTPTQVHKQTAIAFRTPRYKSLEIDQPVQAFIQLRRPSDGATSEALPFQITPLSDPAVLKRKRQKLSNESDVRKIKELEQMRTSTSPNPYMVLGAQQMVKLSPIYASRTPSPHDPYHQHYGMQGAAAAFPAVNTNSLPVYPPYGINMEPEQPHPQQTQLLSEATNILNMDTHEFSLELNLNRLDSRDLAELNLLDDGTLSNSLSSSLILGDQSHPNNNNTDSLTKLATSTYNDLCYQ
ncbi:embryonic polarity protein dorsal isoform X6 [Halyomorpha halys]|uniref:embryonic polarity protein dorsal isoform X6 n=1 Tax=Halyomorpha halys TaxID=286706 RepID=UPI0006D4E6B0|nr:embryonic polarity protein dorsal-like isoform X6 [Halyomorpha halys]